MQILRQRFDRALQLEEIERLLFLRAPIAPKLLPALALAQTQKIVTRHPLDAPEVPAQVRSAAEAKPWRGKERGPVEGLMLFAQEKSGVVWLGFAYAVIGPLFLTNILWFTAVDRVGAGRASIFNNMQPFFGVLFALLILSESIHGLEIAGGALIFAGIAYERVGREVTARVPTVE